MAKPPQDINLPDGSSRPQWATEETLLKLLDKFGGAGAAGVGGASGASSGGGGSAGGGGGGSNNPVDQMEKMGEMAKSLRKNFGDMGDATKRHSSLTLVYSAATMEASKKAFEMAKGSASVDGAMKTLSSGMSTLGQYIGGPWGLALQIAAVGLTMLANKTKEYLDSMGEMVDAGLAYSGKLGESAALAANSGLALKSFYAALKETGQAYRALGSNGMDAARAFGDLQTQVRDTYGTFGMSADELAKGSADFINIFAATGAKGADAVSGAAKSYGKSLETLRTVSIATGASMNEMKKSLGDLLKSPIIINGLRAFGRGTEDAVVAMARGASGFEAVFGKLGKELYSQTAEARAAGLSIINTELGQAIAPFADIQVLDNFRKKLEDNTVSAGEFQASAQAMVNSMGPNIPTLQLLAQQGDANAKKLLEMYNNAKKYTEMSAEEVEAIKAKGRAEEKLKSISEKMGAMFEKVSNKLFGMIDLIPSGMIDAMSVSLEFVTDALGALVDVVTAVLKPAMWLIGKTFDALIPPFRSLGKAIVYLISGVGSIISGFFEPIMEALDPLINMSIKLGHFLWEGFTDIVSFVWDAIAWPLKKIGSLFGFVWDIVKTATTGFASFMEGIGGWLWDSFKGAMQATFDILMWPTRQVIKVASWFLDGWMAIGRKLFDFVGNFGGWLWDGLKAIISSVGEALSGFASTVGEKMAAIGETIKEGAMWPFRQVSNLISSAADLFMKPFSSMNNWFKSTWLGKKIMGGEGNTSASTTTDDASSSSPIMNSQVSSVSPGVVDANVKRESFSYGNMSDVQRTQTELMQESLAHQRQAVAQQRLIADNTERTGKAVEQAGAYA